MDTIVIQIVPNTVSQAERFKEAKIHAQIAVVVIHIAVAIDSIKIVVTGGFGIRPQGDGRATNAV